MVQDFSSIKVEIRVSHYDGRWSAAAQVDLTGEHDRTIPPLSAEALNRANALERVITRVIEEVELFTMRESALPSPKKPSESLLPAIMIDSNQPPRLK